MGNLAYIGIPWVEGGHEYEKKLAERENAFYCHGIGGARHDRY